MPTLFVDCDDTLILWNTTTDPKTGLFIRSGDNRDYELNQTLIADVSCFISHHPEYEAVVWSGGGVDYAMRWAEKCFPHPNFPVGIRSKDMRTPQGDDICVDDMYGELAPRDKRVRVVGLTGLNPCVLCLKESS